jgi:hypothetical protein
MDGVDVAINTNGLEVFPVLPVFSGGFVGGSV